MSWEILYFLTVGGLPAAVLRLACDPHFGLSIRMERNKYKYKSLYSGPHDRASRSIHSFRGLLDRVGAHDLSDGDVSQSDCRNMSNANVLLAHKLMQPIRGARPESYDRAVRSAQVCRKFVWSNAQLIIKRECDSNQSLIESGNSSNANTSAGQSGRAHERENRARDVCHRWLRN